MKDSERDTVVVQNVNVPVYTNRVDGKKYLATKEALLKVLPDRGPGLTQAEMTNGVLPYLPKSLFPGGKTAAWWVKCVQLDFEATGVMVRDRKAKPLRWRLTQ